ncbi:hypothetical protein, partial [Sphaerotilus montanus]|uniref:hypothetical protein n=1 Tax=Sphaerotilus montanus TaxID=522889 RepID=UPI003FA1F1C6
MTMATTTPTPTPTTPPATTADPAAFFDAADQMALVSSEVLRFRIRNRPRLGAAEKSQLEAVEMQLDDATAQLRAQGIEALSALTQAAREEVEGATREAEAQLRRIRKTERASQIATGVLGGPVNGTIRIPATVETEKGFDLTLQCIHQYRTRSGKNSTTHR